MEQLTQDEDTDVCLETVQHLGRTLTQHHSSLLFHSVKGNPRPDEIGLRMVTLERPRSVDELSYVLNFSSLIILTAFWRRNECKHR